MDISVFSILTIIMILVATFLFKRKRKAPIHLKEGIPAEDAFTLKTVESCGLVIDKALECLSTGDEIAVCRNHVSVGSISTVLSESRAGMMKKHAIPTEKTPPIEATWSVLLTK